MRTSHKLKSTLKTIPEQIRCWQRANGLSNKDAAIKLGVPLRTYGDWKGGQHAPRGFAKLQLVEKLGDVEFFRGENVWMRRRDGAPMDAVTIKRINKNSITVLRGFQTLKVNKTELEKL